MTMATLALRDVTYAYRTKYQTIQALNGVSCAFERGSIYAIIGKSGSGKSTLLSLMAGLDLPTTGQVLFEGTPTERMQLDAYRRTNVAMIYQSFRLFPLMTACENVMFPMEMRGVAAREAQLRAKKLIQSVGLPQNVFHRYPGMLSGGEQQRVAIARALAMNTHLILADEPTGNLDSASSALVIKTLCRLAHESDYCVIVVTHDLGMLHDVDTVYRMNDGRLVQAKSRAASPTLPKQGPVTE